VSPRTGSFKCTHTRREGAFQVWLDIEDDEVISISTEKKPECPRALVIHPLYLSRALVIRPLTGNTTMKKAFVTSLAGSFALAVYLSTTTANAGQLGIKANANWNFNYDDIIGQGAVNDFHLRLVDSSQNINVTTDILKSVNAPAGQGFSVVGTFQNNSNNSKQVDMDWKWNPNVAKGGKFNLVIAITQDQRNQITVQNAYFTKDGVYASGPGPDIGPPGFRWHDPEQTEFFRVTYGEGLLNNWADIWIHNLQFMINQPDRDLSDTSFFSANYSPPESTAPFRLTRDSESSPFTVAGYTPGTFIYGQGTYADSGDLNTASYQETFTFGHQTGVTGVPEPSTLTLIGIGSAVAFYYSRYRRRRGASARPWERERGIGTNGINLSRRFLT
jgi:hypothetical protein